jgi:1-acyl-sn-glycerol-3-phosphate acyltransferase
MATACEEEMTDPARSALDRVSVFGKRLFLCAYGPFVICFVAVAPIFCGTRPGFRGWYWRVMRNWVRIVLNALSIHIDVDDASKAALAAGHESLVVANHKSHLDVLVLMAALPNERWITFAAKSDLAKLPFFRKAFEAAGILLVDRQEPVSALFALTSNYADMHPNVSLVVFPEGTRITSGNLGVFKPGACKIAHRLGKRIQPICIVGTSELLPRSKFIPRSGKVKVSVLNQFLVQEHTGLRVETERLRQHMSYHFGQLTGS